MECIRDAYDRKIRLLESSLSDSKAQTLKLRVISEEYEQNKTKYDNLKGKYAELMQQNVQYEPIVSELSEWKNIIREMCHELFANDEIDLNNEFDLKLCLKELNEKYIILVKERDEFQSNMKINASKLNECSKEVNRLRSEIGNERKMRDDILLKHEAMVKEAKDAKIDSLSYKNILKTYNAMSPSKNNQKIQIQKLHQENKGLIDKMKELRDQIKELEQEREGQRENMRKMENERDELLERLSKGECVDALDEKVLSFKNNPLKLAMDRCNMDKEKNMIATESEWWR